jgi:hypothetical protein
MLTSKDPRLAGRVAFTYPNFVSYTIARFFIVVALEMQSVAVAWQVYAITRRPIDLGYVGLASSFFSPDTPPTFSTVANCSCGVTAALDSAPLFFSSSPGALPTRCT